MKTFFAIMLSLFLSLPVWAASDNPPDWYYPEWLAAADHAPMFQMRDTVNKYGRYASETKTVTLKDIIKYHGHFCGGLVEGATALRVAFDQLFPDGVIDRTDLRIASNNSACGGDVAAYLTGARTVSAAILSTPSSRRATLSCSGSLQEGQCGWSSMRRLIRMMCARR